MSIRRIGTGLICALAGLASSHAGVTYLPSGNLVSSLSYDGSAAAGNIIWDNSYETFRWTPAGGIERLGLATYPVIFTAAGTPDISYSGKQVSASILSSDYALTQGVWDATIGWIETMPPAPENGAIVDNSYGSAWGLSGNGRSISGFYWSQDVKAIASSWTMSTGVVALGQIEGRSARANATNYDGSVACGWEEDVTGSWMPRAWRNGVKIELDNLDGGINEGNCINGTGDIIGGSSFNEDLYMNVGTIWTWNGSSYDALQMGVLDDTPMFGRSVILGVSNAGDIAVGMNEFGWGNTVGIVWTPSGGMVPATTFFAAHGIAIPDTYGILDCYTVSGDGSTIAATVMDMETFEMFSAVIRLRELCPGDLNLDGQVDDSDFVLFASQYDALDCADPAMPGFCRGDLNNDGLVDDADFVAFAQAYDQLICP